MRRSVELAFSKMTSQNKMVHSILGTLIFLLNHYHTMENKDKLFDKLRRINNCQGIDITLLDESNIAGASLNPP